jgi:hypothetical protein
MIANILHTITNYLNKIPHQWQKRLIKWGIPFLFGLIIVLIWDIGTLLVILFMIFFLSFLIFSIIGGTKTKQFSQWSITEFFKRIRGMLIFALLPVAWELIKKPSVDSIIGICVLGIVALTIWQRFDQMIADMLKSMFGVRNKRKRH